MDALVAFDHLLAGHKFTIVTDNQPLMYLRTDRRPTRKQMRWRTHLAKYMAKIVYKPGVTNYLADALSHLYRHDTGRAEYARDPTEQTEDLKATNTHENSPHTVFATSLFSDTISRFEPLHTLGDHAECGSDCSMREGNDWGDMVSNGHLREGELNHSATHWTACHKAVCEFHNQNRLAGQVITPESPEVGTMRARYLTEGNESPRRRIDLDRVRKRLATALEHDDPLAECRECDGYDQKVPDAYMAKRQTPLYGGGLAYYNKTVPSIIPPTMLQDDCILYDVLEDEGDTPRLEQVLDERDTIQVTTEMQSMWREQLVDAYRKDERYKLALDSEKTAKGGRIEHYRIGDRPMLATTRKELQALYIPKGHAANGQTLRELVISEVYDKGHHSSERSHVHYGVPLLA